MEERVQELFDLITELNTATLAYDKGFPVMTDEEWDNKYFHLLSLERELNFTIPESPTQSVRYEVVNALETVEHNHRMLSLDKTKDLSEVANFLGANKWLAMAKMDGLTCSLHYQNGRLVSAETRGNGDIGENILHNAKVIPSIPNRINSQEDLIIDGEIICTYQDFKTFETEYANPRNFASGSIRLLDANQCAQRKLTFIAWEVIQGMSDLELLSSKLVALQSLGFYTVPFVLPEHNAVDDGIVSLVKILARQNGYPIDGLVFKFNDVAYGRSQGETSHHLKNAIAYKFYDESYETKLRNIEWTMGRTGVLTPVAVFDAINIEDSEVERASLHNISVMEATLGTLPWLGQKVNVYKANMIIPQIASAEEDDGDPFRWFLTPPEVCPICGEPVQRVDNGTCINLICNNPSCEGKFINRIDHFCGKNGLNIRGLSLMTLTKLSTWGWLNSFADIFKLKDHKAEWIAKAGFGEKSVSNILNAIETSKDTSLEAFISAIGIPLIGKTVAKDLCNYISSYDDLRQKVKDNFNFGQYSGFAEGKTEALWNYDYTDADEVYTYMNINAAAPVQTISEATLANKTVVITGTLHNFKNRSELQSAIELRGGKVAGSVSRNTFCLINNDNTSTSSKNLSAQKLGIPILTETEFCDMYLKN